MNDTTKAAAYDLLAAINRHVPYHTNDAQLLAAILSAIEWARADARRQALEDAAAECVQTNEEGENPDCWDWHAKDYAKAIRALGTTGEQG
jgi:hypothetical protein